MKELEHRVRRARRRLWLNRWLSQLGWTMTAAAAIFAGVVLVQRLIAAIEAPGWLWIVLASALAAGACLAATIWMFVTRESLETAAACLDEAAGLKERLSTALYCTSPRADVREDPFARAVIVDAERLAGRVIPRDCIPIRWPRSARFAVGGMLAALGVLWLFPEVDLAGVARRRRQLQQREQMVQRAEAEVRPVLVRTYEKVAQKLPNVAEELTRSDPLKNARLETPLDVRRTAVKKVEQLADRLRERRDAAELRRVEEFKKLMRRLAGQAAQPTVVGKLAGALARGDLAAARAALAELRKQLSEAPRTAEEKRRAEQLKAQIRELSDALARMAEEDRKLVDRLRGAGLKGEALSKALAAAKRGDFDTLRRQLAAQGLSAMQVRRLVQQCRSRCGACDVARRLAQGLGAAASRQGGAASGAAALDGLSMADAQLSEMESLQQELAELNSALAELEQTKNRLGTFCKMCNGTGMCNGQTCTACMGRGLGMGLNPGQGQGNVAPEEQTAFGLVQRRTPVKTGRGSIISQRFIDGEQFKGEVSSEFVEAALSAERDVTDAIARERIPRVYHTAVKKYFTRFRESLPADRNAHDQERE